MNESERLADQLKRALNGRAWHGPSWRGVLRGVSRAQALQRPIAGGHSIAEIVLHATTWHDAVRRRLVGETPRVGDAEDWPEADLPDDAAWRATVQELFRTGRELCETVERFPVGRLHIPRPKAEGTWYALAIGELQHSAYHAAQVSLLKKADTPAAQSGRRVIGAGSS